MEATGALGSAPALLSASCLRLCFVTRSQALALESLEAQMLCESSQESEAEPSPVLRPSILSGAFVRVRFDDSYRLDRVAATQLAGDGRIAVRLQAMGRCVPLTSLSRGGPLDDAAAREQQGQQELAALQAALAEQPPSCWEIAAACCRLSRAWQWAQEPAEFAAALQHGLPSLAAQLEDAAAVQAVLSCVEPAAAAPAPAPEPSAAVAADQFLAAMAPPPGAPAPAVPTPAQQARLTEPAAAAAAAAAPAGDGGFFFEAPGGSSSNWEAPSEQYQRIVTFVPDDDMEQQRQKRGRGERGSPPAKRQRSEPSPAAARSADGLLLGSSLAEHKRRRIQEDVPPGSRREALLVKAVECSCLRGEERQGGDLGNALAALDSDWKARLGGHSITDLLLAMSERGLVRAEVRRDANGSGRNVYYSRGLARSPPRAAKQPALPTAQRPTPPLGTVDHRQQLAADVPPGSRREALLMQAVAELDSQRRGQLLSPANLGSILNRHDCDWKARLGGHRLNSLVWELHRRGLVRAEDRASASGQLNLFFTNLRC